MPWELDRTGSNTNGTVDDCRCIMMYCIMYIDSYTYRIDKDWKFGDTLERLDRFDRLDR